HIVKAGWVTNHDTSILAFDLVQFFPSINHQAMLAILERQDFVSCLVKLFKSYLVGRFMRYSWDGDLSPPMGVDVGVGQGSALSPVLSTLTIAPVMELFKRTVPREVATLISYIDDGTVITQAKNVDDNLVTLHVAYAVILTITTALGLI